MLLARYLAISFFLWGAAAGAEEKINDFGGAVPIHPETWVEFEDYPEKAVRERRTGTVRFAFDITREGRAENCVVTLSSGSKDLDEASCRALEKRGRFKPAADKQGTPIPTKGQSQINWLIPN